jgi:hypothetical protein
MSYEIVLGSLGPTFPLTLTADSGEFALDAVNDTVVLRYLDPDGDTHEVTMTITAAASGEVEYTWVAGDLPVVGAYKGQVTVTRANDLLTFPRTFPSTGAKVIWWVHSAI